MLIIGPLAYSQSKLEQNFADLSNSIMTSLKEFYPVNASEKGITDYDGELANYSSGSVRKMIKTLKRYETRLHKYIGTNLSPQSKINWKLLKSNCDIALQDLNNIRWHEKNPYLYVDEAINGVYLLMISESSPPEIKVQNIISRMKQVPELFEDAEDNLKSPPQVFVDLALEYLETGANFYEQTKEQLMVAFPDLSRDIESAADNAIAAMQEFGTFLKNIQVGPDIMIGIGKNNYDYKLKHEYFLDFDSDSLLKIGENLLEKYTAEYKNYLAYIDSLNEGVDSVFAIDCISKEDILRYYNWEVDQTKLFLTAHDLVTIPEDIGECEVVETPEFLTNVISSIAYHPPGSFNTVQKGLFYVRPIPDEMDKGLRESYYRYIQRRGFKSSVVHEAYPGHHLQLQMTSRLNDDIRKWQENYAMMEGWALYCEEMMYNQDFYGNDQRKYLNILGGIVFRAARIIIDVKLQTGQMTYNEAVRWMAETLDADTSWTSVEVSWYSMAPTIPMSYLIGKQQLIELRDDLKARESDAFVLKNFHDRFISEGALPIPIIREIWGLD